MAINSVEVVERALNQQIEEFSQLLGVPSASIRQILPSITSMLLGGLLQKGGTTQGAKEVAELVAQFGSSTATSAGTGPNAQVSDVASRVQSGEKLLDQLFGDRLTPVARQMSDRFHVDVVTFQKLLGLVAPAVLRALGQQPGLAGLDAIGWQQYLTTQREPIMRDLPTEIKMSVGTESSGPTVWSGVRKLLPIIGVLLLAIVLWRLVRTNDQPVDPEPFPDEEILEIDLPE